MDAPEAPDKSQMNHWYTGIVVMHKSIAAIATAVTLAAIASGPAQAGMAGIVPAAQPSTGQQQLIHKTGKKYWKKRRFAKGLMFGLGVAALAAGGTVSVDGDYIDSEWHERRCRRWRRRCYFGNSRACWKFDRRC
jgi:hypothetical protein